MSGHGRRASAHSSAQQRDPAAHPRMGQQITKDFKGQRVHLIGVLKGASIFLSDLIRQIHLEVSLDFMAVSSYGHGKQSSGQVRLTKDLDTSIEGLNVILVEDILDTGLTLSYLQRVLHAAKTARPAHRRVARQARAPHQEGEGRLHRLPDSQRVRGRLRSGLRRALSQSEGCLHPLNSAQTVGTRRKCARCAATPRETEVLQMLASGLRLLPPAFVAVSSCSESSNTPRYSI